MTVRWFNMQWIYNTVKAMADSREKVIIGGKIDFDSKYGYGLNQPEVFEPYNQQALRIYPVYRTIPGMSSSYLEETMRKAIAVGIDNSEILPKESGALETHRS